MNSTKRNAGSEIIPQKRNATSRGTSSSTTGLRLQKNESAHAEGSAQEPIAELVQLLRDDLQTLSTIPMNDVESADSHRARTAREEWFNSIIERWQINAGKVLSEEQYNGLVEELHRRHYSSAMAKLAEEWILRGDSIKYGRITINTFFPTAEQLDTLGLHLDAVMARERAAGYADGRSAGRIEGIDILDADLRYIRLLHRTTRLRHYAMRTRTLRAREEQVDIHMEQLRRREQNVTLSVRYIQRKLNAILQYLCPADREAITHIINTWNGDHE